MHIGISQSFLFQMSKLRLKKSMGDDVSMGLLDFLTNGGAEKRMSKLRLKKDKENSIGSFMDKRMSKLKLKKAAMSKLRLKKNDFYE